MKKDYTVLSRRHLVDSNDKMTDKQLEALDQRRDASA